MSYTDDGEDLREIFENDLESKISGYSEEILDEAAGSVPSPPLPAKGSRRQKPVQRQGNRVTPQTPAPQRPKASPPAPSPSQAPQKAQRENPKAAAPASLPEKKKPVSDPPAKPEKTPVSERAPVSKEPSKSRAPEKTASSSKPLSQPQPESPPVVKTPVKLRPPDHVKPHPHSEPVSQPRPAAKSTPNLPEPTPAEELVSIEDEELFPFDENATPDFSSDSVLSFEEEPKKSPPASLPPLGRSTRRSKPSESSPAPRERVSEPKAKPSSSPEPPLESAAPRKSPAPEAKKPRPEETAKEPEPSRGDIPPPASLEKRAAIAAAAVSTSESESPRREAKTGELLLNTKGLVKVYDGKTVVNGVDIGVRRGEIVGLLGPNGAGKTTSFYMIVGLVPPNGGQVNFNGADVTTMPMYQRARLGMGYLPQEESIFRKLTVEENIMAVMETLQISRREKVERCNELLERFSITHIRKNVALTCSGGEKRRLTIARSLVTKPSLLMLDEPFSGVDPIAVNEIQTIVEDLRKSGLAILITDHNARQTLELVDRAYLIYEGRVLREGSREFLINDKVSRELYLGDRFSM